ncbi:MAG: PHP-associated domain-containing protein [Candidatus Binatales bacterium]
MTKRAGTALVDLHVHTRLSADSNVDPEAYMQALARAGNPLAAICFTEHRLYPTDAETDRLYRQLESDFGVAIFKGIEADTDLGHLLLFGVTPALTRRFDLGQRMLRVESVIEVIDGEGGIAIPSHPFRDSGFGPRLEELLAGLGPALRAVEAINGQNTADQNGRAIAAAAKLGLAAVGGSDAHFASDDWFLTSATELEREVRTVEELCAELRAGRARPHVFARRQG